MVMIIILLIELISDQNEANYWYYIKKHKKIVLEEHGSSKAFIEYSNIRQDVHKSFEVYNLERKLKY